MKVDSMRIVVIGLGVSGRAVSAMLARRGARVFASDVAADPMTAGQRAELESLGVTTETGGHSQDLLKGADLVVISPGVDPARGPAAEALAAGMHVVSEVEAASWFFAGALAGITGSNGKSTTTAMAADMLTAAGARAVPGGNLGRPLAAIVDEEPDVEIVVLELSSFQLERVERFRAETAVLLNITPDHLDRYPDLNAYVAAKAHLWDGQQDGDWAIYGADDRLATEVVAAAPGWRIPFTTGERPGEPGCWTEGREGARTVVALLPGSDVPIELFNEQDVPLPGKHNLSNAMAAGVVATRYGAHPDAIIRGLSEFRGLPHRLQFIGRVGKVRFYDDSKATNVEAALAALGAFTRDVVLIAGGKHKGSSYRALRDGLARCGRAVVLIGQAAPYLKEDLDGVVAVHEASDLEEAVVMAWELAKPEGTVLLAPACSSFDMFRDFNHRGEVFQTAVERIVTREGAAA